MQALVDGVTIEDLEQAIHARATIGCEVDQMRVLYDNGDAAALEPRLVVRDQATLIDARNAKWQAQLERYATTDGAFVAVGLGHLLGTARAGRCPRRCRVRRRPRALTGTAWRGMMFAGFCAASVHARARAIFASSPAACASSTSHHARQSSG